MGIEDKSKNAAQEATGKVKEVVGEATGSDDLKAEGKTDQVKADAKQAGEKIKDAVKDTTDAVKKAGEKVKDAVTD